MLRTLLRDESNQFRVVEDPSAISEIVLNKDRLLWLDLERPTPDEFAMIQEEFGLHPLAIEDAMVRHQRPKVDQYDNFYLVIFYAVAVEQPGSGHIPGRRGLQGSSFLHESETEPILVTGQSEARPNGAPDSPEGNDGTGEKGSGEEDGDEPLMAVPVVEREWEHGHENDERIVLNELTLFLGENYLITAHEHPIRELEEAARRWSQNVTAIGAESPVRSKVPGTRRLSPGEKAGLNSNTPAPDGAEREQQLLSDDEDSEDGVEITGVPGAAGSPVARRPRDLGILLYSVLDTIVDNYFPVVDEIVDRIEDLEEQVFERFTHKAFQSIFTLKKDLLALRRVLSPERDVLNVLTRRDIPIFENSTLVYFQDVYDHVVRVTDSIDTYRDLLTSVLDGFLSMQSNRLNETVQTLTSLSIILMSVAAITGWYGMNFEFMPELRSALGYPGVMVAVIILIIIEVIFFKRKKWL